MTFLQNTFAALGLAVTIYILFAIDVRPATREPLVFALPAGCDLTEVLRGTVSLRHIVDHQAIYCRGN